MIKYSVSEDKIVRLGSTIKKDGAIKFVRNMTSEQLIELGYLDVIYKSKPNRRYFVTTDTVGKVENDKYTVSYLFEPVNLDTLKNRMVKDIQDTAKKKLYDATSKYAVEEMSSWKKLEDQSRLIVNNGGVDGLNDDDIDLILLESTMSGEDPLVRAGSILKKAVALNQLRAYVVTERKKRTDIVLSFETIDDCIAYENFEFTTQGVNEEGENIDVSTVINKCKDWRTVNA